MTVAERQAAAISLLSTAASTAGEDALEALSQEDRASLLNTLAWFDEDPLSPDLTRGPRGAVTHLSARFLALDAAPELPPQPSEERARAFADDCHLGRALFRLADTDELRLVRAVERGGDRQRFVFHQFLGESRIHDEARGGEVGAASLFPHRRQLRLFYPRGSELSIRSLTLRE